MGIHSVSDHRRQVAEAKSWLGEQGLRFSLRCDEPQFADRDEVEKWTGCA